MVQIKLFCHIEQSEISKIIQKKEILQLLAKPQGRQIRFGYLNMAE